MGNGHPPPLLDRSVMTVLWSPSQNSPFWLELFILVSVSRENWAEKSTLPAVSVDTGDPGEVPQRKGPTPKLLSGGWTVPLTRNGGGGGSRETGDSWQPFLTP